MKSVPFLFVLILLTACNFTFGVKEGNGNIKSEEIEVGDFNRINVGGNYKINLIQSERPRVVVEMDENLFDYLEVEVFGDQLNINSDYNLRPTESVNIDIFYTELEELISSGASSLEHRDVLKSDALKVSLSGAGAINLKLDVDELNLDLSGAGSIELEGYVYSQVINLSGAGSLEAGDLESRYAEINISGIGNAKVNVKKTLNATISGMGNIEYYGHPDEINKNVSGLGKIKSGESGRDEDNI